MPCAGRGAGILSRQSPEPCPCPGLCPQDSSLCQLRSSDVPRPGWAWLGAVPRAVPALGRGGESVSLCCDTGHGAEPPCAQPWLSTGAVAVPVFWELQLVQPWHCPNAVCLPLHPHSLVDGFVFPAGRNKRQADPFHNVYFNLLPRTGHSFTRGKPLSPGREWV